MGVLWRPSRTGTASSPAFTESPSPRIERLSKDVCPDTHTKSLQNRLNRDEQTGIYLPLTRSRDCQEIDADCGRAMIQILRRDDLGQMV